MGIGPRQANGWLALVVGAGLAGCATVEAPPSGDAERGRAVVEKWCATCHALPDASEPAAASQRSRARAQRASSAPPFAEIARRPGRDDAYFRTFFAGDHFPMPTYRLFEHERDDVIAFLRSLR